MRTPWNCKQGVGGVWRMPSFASLKAINRFDQLWRLTLEGWSLVWTLTLTFEFCECEKCEQNFLQKNRDPCTCSVLLKNYFDNLLCLFATTKLSGILHPWNVVHALECHPSFGFLCPLCVCCVWLTRGGRCISSRFIVFTTRTCQHSQYFTKCGCCCGALQKRYSINLTMKKKEQETY